MRNIKFMAWHIDEKKMYEVQSLDFFFGLAEIQWWSPSDKHGERHNSKLVMLVDGITQQREIELMQYTEQNDIYGKEIYEGMKVHQTNVLIGSQEIDFRGTVKFYDGTWWIESRLEAVPLFNETCENSIVEVD